MAQIGPNDDPEGDSVVNLMEYATGGSAAVYDVAGAALVLNSAGTAITFRHQPDRADIRTRLQESANLHTWSDLATASGGASLAGQNGATVSIVSGPDYHTATVTIRSAGAWQLCRLVVEML